MHLQHPPKVTVILPFYNAGVTLERALQSIQKQSFENFECILVDNNSTDNSPEIAKAYQQKDKRFILTGETRQGVVFASNKGSSLARGEYICRMDADDWMFPLRLKMQSDFLIQNKDYDVVAGRVEYRATVTENRGFSRYVNWVNSIETYDEILLRRFIESPIVNPSAMWRRRISRRLDMYREGDFPEDYELWLRWLQAGIRIHKIKQPLLRWYDSKTRLTRTDKRYRKDAFYNLKTEYLLQWLRQNNPHHPKVAVWGASRISRKRTKILQEKHIEISHYIDISEKRKLDKQVILFSEIPAPDKVFILVYIAHTEIREEIKKYLDSRGFCEGTNYLFVS